MHESLDQEIRTLQSIFWSERDPDGLAFASLADAFRRKGALRNALDLLTDGMSRHPDFVTGHVVATRLYADNGMDSEAELAARRVLELDPENLVGLSTLAAVLAGKGETGEAARHRTMLMSVDPDSDEAHAVAALDLDDIPGTDTGTVPTGADPAEITELVPETMYQEGSPDSLLDDLTLQPMPGDETSSAGEESPDEADDELARAMDALGLVGVDEDIEVSTAEADVDVAATDEMTLPGPETEFADLDALGSDEPVEEIAGTMDFGGPIDLDALAPDEPADESAGDVMDLAALAPDDDEAAEDAADEVMDLAALAPDDEADDEVMDLAVLAPDEPADEAADDDVVDLAALAPDDEGDEGDDVIDLAALAPDDEADEPDDVIDLAALAPDDEADESDDVMDLAALAPDDDTEAADDVMDLAALAPDDEPADDVMDLAALAPDDEAEEPDSDVIDLADLAPTPMVDLDDVDVPEAPADEPEVVDLELLAPEESVEELAEAITDEALDEEDPDDDEPSKPVYTRTLADLYVKQGFPEKALSVLKALQEVTPDDEDLARRIEALEKGEPEEAISNAPRTPSRTASGGNGHSEDDVETRARELAEHGQDEAGGADVDTPFAWGEGADASGDGGESDEPAAGSYFDALLEWENRGQS